MAVDNKLDAPGDRDESAETRIQLDDVRKTFDAGQVVACENISLDIGAEEFVVLLGPSGCGKTTTLRCISGLEQPTSGRVYIGEDVTHDKPKDRDLAFVFQSIALFPHMSVRSNIQFGLNMKTDLSKEEKNTRVEDVSEMLGISDLLDRNPGELSGGQQQRVSLGRAMVMEPAAFLLDEPFSALDAQLRDQMRTEVKRLQRELETAMVFVTHDQEEAMTLGDKIVVMNDGHIQQVGTPYAIYNDPKNLFIANFIGSPSVNTMTCDVTNVEAGSVTLSTDLFEKRIETDAEFTSLTAGDSVTLAIRPEHLTIDGVDSLFEGEVTLVEPHGANDAVYLTTETDHEIAAMVDQGRIDRSTDSVRIGFVDDQVWLFDAEGERVL